MKSNIKMNLKTMQMGKDQKTEKKQMKKGQKHKY